MFQGGQAGPSQGFVSSNEGRPIYSGASSTTTSSYANMDTSMDTSMDNPLGNAMSTSSESWQDLVRQWDNLAQTLTSPLTGNSVPQYSYFPQTTAQPQSSAQQASSSATYNFSGLPQQPNFQLFQSNLPQGQVGTTAGQTVTSAGIPSFSAGSIRQNRPAPAPAPAPSFPQAGSSSGPAHQRRTQGTDNFLAQGTSAHHTARSSNHRRRSRPRNIDYTTPHSTTQPTQQRPSHTQQNQNVTSTANSSSTPRAEPHHQSTQPHASFNQANGTGVNHQFEHWLRSMRPSQIRELYASEFARNSRGDPFLIPSSTNKKLVDTPKEPRPDPKEAKELNLNMECKICMDQLVDTVLLPCGHAILCRWCAAQQIPSARGFPKPKSDCPLCREPVRQKVRVSKLVCGIID